MCRQIGLISIFVVTISSLVNANDYTPQLNIYPPNTSVKLQDNLYQFVNGLWSAANPIPDNRPWNGAYVEQYESVQNRLGAIVHKAVSNPQLSLDDKKIAHLYNSITDITRRDTMALSPLASELEVARSVKSRQKMAQLFAIYNRQYYSLITGDTMSGAVPFSIGFWPDDKDSSRWSVVMTPSGLGMPSTDYYLNTDKRFIDIRDEYLKHIQRILLLAKLDQPELHAQQVINLETKLAACQKHDQSNLVGSYNPMSYSEIKKAAPAFDWSAYWAAAKFKPSQKIIVKDVQYLSCLNKLFVSETETWPYYLSWQLLRHHSPYLDKSFADADFDFYGRTLFGNKEPVKIHEHAVSLIDFWLSDILGRRYVQDYFSESARVKTHQMTLAIRDAYLKRIQQSDWLSDAAKAEAIRKLQTLKIKIGYPSKWQEKLRVELDPNDLIGNLRKITEANYNWHIAQLSHSVDPDIWFDSVQSYNAYYNATTNDIVFPAAKLQIPLFDVNMPDAYNFGGLGSLIAHEMAHALDDQGSQYDADGKLRNWWSDADLENFHQRTTLLIAQYNQYSPLPNQFVKGDKTLSENIADLTGIVMAYAALEQTKPNLTKTEKDMFFTAWATRWRANIRESLMLRILASDTHAPAEYRCNGPLKNLPAFYEYAHLKPGDQLYLPPEQRVRIW